MQMKKCLPGEAKKKGVTDIFRRAAAEGRPSAVLCLRGRGIRVFAVRESVFRGVISRSETAGARRLNTKSAAPVLSGAASVMKDGRCGRRSGFGQEPEPACDMEFRPSFIPFIGGRRESIERAVGRPAPTGNVLSHGNAGIRGK